MTLKRCLCVFKQVRNFATEANLKASKFPSIPGPKYYPFLGSINELLTMGKAEKLHLTIDNYHQKYGSIFHVKLGPIDSVFISSADYMRSIFAHEGKYPMHIIPPSWLYFNQKYNVERGLLFMDGEEWLKHRQIMNNFLLKDYRWFESLVQATCDNFVNKIKRIANNESDVAVENLEDEIYLWTSYLILNLMLGSSTSEQCDRRFDENVWKAVKSFQKIMKLSAKLMSVPPKVADKVLNLKSWRDLEDAQRESLEISRNLISMIDKEMKSSDVGLLKKLQSENLSEDMIARLFSDLLIAAVDTSAKSVQWFLHTLAKDNSLQSKIRKNVLENPTDFESPMVRASLREVLRLYPVAPFISRIVDSDVKVGQYEVPKGWMAIMSLYSSGRDPKNFSNPLKFAPERWMRDGSEAEFQVFKASASMPFAIGSRSCVGKKIATYEIHCLITKLLQQFTLKSLNDDEVNFKLELVGVPDKKILIAFRNLIPRY